MKDEAVQITATGARLFVLGKSGTIYFRVEVTGPWQVVPALPELPESTA